MPALEISVNGTANIYEPAERALMTVQCTSSTPDQERSLENVKTAATAIQSLAKTLRVEPSGSDAASTGGPLKAPLTEWTQERLHTYSGKDYDETAQARTERKRLVRHYTASTSFTLKFQDFSVLSSVAGKIAVLSHAEISSITWHLLDATRKAQERRARILAVQDAMEKANDFAEAATGRRVAKATYIGDTGSFSAGGYGWQMPIKKAMQPQMPMQQPALPNQESDSADDIDLQPGKISVQWSISGKFVVDESANTPDSSMTDA